MVTRLLRAALLAECIFAWLRVPTGTKPNKLPYLLLVRSLCAVLCVVMCELRRASKIGWGCLLLPNGPALHSLVPAAGPAPGGVRLP